MASHVAKGASSEVQPFAPVAWMIVAVPNKGPFSANAEPQVPVEACRNRISPVRTRTGISPFLAAPGVNLFDFAYCAILHQPHREPVGRFGMNLDAHLGYELLLAS